jgi:ABC-type transport system substrate-binding protein
VNLGRWRWRGAPVLAVWVGVCVAAAGCTTTADTSAPTTIVTSDNTTPEVADNISSVSIAMVEPEALAAQHVVSDSAVEIAQLLHLGLTRRGPDGLALPGIASSWSNENLITWTFNLEAGHTFSDGTPVTAATFVESWQHLAQQDTRSRSAFLGIEAGITNFDNSLAGVPDAVIGVRAADELTLEVQLDRSFPWLAEMVAHPAFAPVTTAELASPRLSYPIGTGPFRLEGDYVEGQSMSLVRVNPTGEPGEITRYDVTFVSTEAEAAGAVAAGTSELAIVGDVDTETLDGTGPWVVEPVASNQVLYLGYPTSRGVLSEPEPRRVLSLTIDRPTIAGLLDDRQSESSTFAPRSSVNGASMLCRWCAYRPDEARTFADEQAITPPETPISLHVVSGSLTQTWADTLASTWINDLGWQVNVVTYDSYRALVGYLQSGVPDGPFILPWTGDYPGAEAWIEPLLDRSGADDFVRYGNDTLVEHFDIIDSTTLNDPARVLDMAALNDTLNEALAFVPLSVLNRQIVHDGTLMVGAIGGVTRVDLNNFTGAP